MYTDGTRKKTWTVQTWTGKNLDKTYPGQTIPEQDKTWTGQNPDTDKTLTGQNQDKTKPRHEQDIYIVKT